MAGCCQGAVKTFSRLSGSFGRALYGAIAVFAFPTAGWAVGQFIPYADIAYEHNSNYFALANGAPSPIGSSGPIRALGYERYRLGFEADYDWSQQEFFTLAEGRRFQYQDFSDLDHFEYLIHPGLRWKLGGILSGLLDYQRERTQVSYLQFDASQFPTQQTNVSYSQLFMQVQDIGTASINLQFLPEWRLESQGKINHMRSPRPGTPNFSVRELSDDEGIKYTGFANLSAGLVAEYLDGRYSSGDFLTSPTYHQRSADLAADYTLSGLSVFHGEVGYTDRTQGGGGSVSALSGVISYQRQLTAKTAAGLKLSRAVNEYITGAAPEIDTTAELDVVWNATSKIGLSASYQYVHANIGDSINAGVVAPGRVDRLQTPSIFVKYQALDWLSIRPYYQYQSRRSSQQLNSFVADTYGIELEARFGQQPQALTLLRP